MRLKKKLFIQIPCLNEEPTISQVVRDIPRRKLQNLGLSVKVLVIDDNSSDQTIKRALKAGADFVIGHKKTLGLAISFKDGLDFCLKKGADIIVNTDGDNQYNQGEILKLITPLLRGDADLVIGDRQVKRLKFMPMSKKAGNLIGSFLIRLLTGEKIFDASCGLRAFNADLAKRYNLQSNHTYTHETIIQASNMGAAILSIPVEFKKRVKGSSRLISKGIYDHIKKSSATIIRSVLLYKAFKFLLIMGSISMGLGFLIGIRFLYFFIDGKGNGHIQSLILSSVLINLGFMIIILGFIADMVTLNRKTIEDLKSKLKF